MAMLMMFGAVVMALASLMGLHMLIGLSLAYITEPVTTLEHMPQVVGTTPNIASQR